jgi:peptide/nickel transport system permease protein
MQATTKRLSANNSIKVGSVLIFLILIVSIFAPVLSRYNPVEQNLDEVLQPPSRMHLLGTDYVGRDLLSRILSGTRVTMRISLLATLCALVAGTVLGTMAAYWGGWIDSVLMRIVDLFLGFPRLFLLLMIVGFGRPSLGLTVLGLALFSWMEIARIVRAQVMVVKEMLYVKSAIVLGLTKLRILRRYILPNILGPLIAATTLLVGTLILVESSLSFLGLGVQPPVASWGTILNQGRIDPFGAWWITIFTGLFIVITVVGFNLIGDGLRSFYDPHQSLSWKRGGQ